MKKIAFIVSYIGLLLPYRLRIYFGIIINFILNPLKTNFLLVIKFISKVIMGLLCFVAYFIGLPMTILLKKLTEKDEIFIKPGNNESDIMKRF